jgi:hypothetical protein
MHFLSRWQLAISLAKPCCVTPATSLGDGHRVAVQEVRQDREAAISESLLIDNHIVERCLDLSVSLGTCAVQSVL